MTLQRRTPMKRTPIERRPWHSKRVKKLARAGLSVQGGVFFLETADGARWKWPDMMLTELEWDGTLLDWAFKVPGGTRWKKSWHCTVAQRSDAGFFDRVFLRPGHAFVAELKRRYADGTANSTSREQDEYIYAAIEAGWDVRVWTYPDDAWEAWETLTGLPRERCPYWSETR